MVTNATSLTRSGLSDFIVQRVTAYILLVYTLCVVGFILAHPELSYADWLAYHGSTAMKLFSTLAVLSTAAHAWIGMWTVGTDYIRPYALGKRATVLRVLYQAICVAALFIYVAWALELFWRL